MPTHSYPSIANSSELSPKIVDTYSKDKSEKRDLYSDKNDNAVDVRDEDEDKALSTLNSEEEEQEEEEDMYDSDSETADNDMELQHSEISNIAKGPTHDMEDLFMSTIGYYTELLAG